MASNLGKAYVQIVPSAKGIQSNLRTILEKPSQESGTSSGLGFGSALVSALKPVLAGFSIGKVLSDSIIEGGKLQQSIGGVETLFGSSAETIKNYAKSAFRDAGISANEYMEQSTSFAAALVKSCSGNTAEAAEVANTALKDMSDNANKMGTDMQDIQNAYQGFAKQNYTMLDNLKLGYGGTKTEMQRLLTDAQKLTGVHYDINNLSDVYNAIHAIQENLKITGTTQHEATTTLTGSFGMLKASWKDFLGNISTGQNVFGSFKNVVSSLGIFLGNNLVPMFGNIGKSLITALAESFNNMPGILNAVQKFASDIAAQAPHFIKTGFDLLNKLADGIISALPVMIAKIPTIISTFANIINDNAPTILICGVKLIGKLALGLIQAIPALIANIPKIIIAIVNVWSAFNWLNLGKMAIKGLGNGIKALFGFLKGTGKEALDTVLINILMLPERLRALGGKGISGLVSGIKSLFGALGGAAKNIFEIIVKALASLPSKMHSIGKNIVEGIWKGIWNMGGWITKKIGDFAGGIVKSFKGFLGIHSPSTIMRKEVGPFVGKGLGLGLLDSFKFVKSNILDFKNMILDEMKIDGSDAFDSLGIFKEVKIQMDNEEFSGASVRSNNSAEKNGNVYQTINVNSPKALDASETARQTKNATRELILKLKGV